MINILIQRKTLIHQVLENDHQLWKYEIPIRHALCFLRHSFCFLHFAFYILFKVSRKTEVHNIFWNERCHLYAKWLRLLLLFLALCFALVFFVLAFLRFGIWQQSCLHVCWKWRKLTSFMQNSKHRKAKSKTQETENIKRRSSMVNVF